MRVPKQAIYPTRYLRPLLSADPAAENRFREGFREMLGGRVHVIPLGRARAGLYLLAKFARRPGRKRVVMLPHTIPDVVNMVTFAGCEPVFVDTLPNSTNIDLDHLEQLVDDTVACVIVTHYHVNQDRLPEIRAICRARDVFLFDDCAIALGGDYSGAPIGTLTDASVFSMSGFKALNYVWGGAIATGDDGIAAQLEAEVQQFPRLAASHYKPHMLSVMKYDIATRDLIFPLLTWPRLKREMAADRAAKDLMTVRRAETSVLEDTVLSRPALGALAELSRKFGTVSDHLSHRRRIAEIYEQLLGDRVVSAETSEHVRAGSCYVNYPIVVDEKRRDEVFADLISQNFHCGMSLYPNVQETAAFSGCDGRSRNLSRLVASTITLPTHLKVQPDYAATLARAVLQSLQTRRARSPARSLAARGALVSGLASATNLDLNLVLSSSSFLGSIA